MPLTLDRYSLDEHVNANHTITVETGTTPEDLLNPALYANISNRMNAYDHIRVRTDTGEWYAELLVLDCGKNWARVVQLYFIDLRGKETELPDNDVYNKFAVMHRGPHLKWCVIRKEDKEPIKEQCNSKQEAQSWLSSYVLTM